MGKTKTTKKTIVQFEPTHYVGIGASAGGLEALEEFFKTMPKDTGMAFIVVQHLSPDYKSMMVELLSRKTSMPVLQIEDGTTVEANRIYLVPPKKNLEIFHSQLFLNEQVRDAGLNLPIDIFFRSLAIDQKKKAIGIILSGTGSDGTLGARAIKEQGGMVMVQDYTSAKFDGMPKSAISTGLVDYILEAGKMSDALIKYVKHPLVAKTDSSLEPNKEETDFVKILSLIRSHVGEDFSYYKPKTIIRRIEHRISVNQFRDSEEYIQLLLKSKRECEILAKEFLIGVTQFFRDAEAFELFSKDVLPEVFKDHEEKKQIRMWSAACSTGEEAYTVAILCLEYMRRHNINVDLKIFATDVDKDAIKFAGLASYPDSIVSDVPQNLLKSHFIKKRDSYQINDKIRQMVIFSHHNVIADPPFSKIDAIICRNLLIYLKPEVQKKVLGLFQYSLSNGGFLFLGSSESLSEVSEAFETVSSKWKLFRYRKGYPAPLLASLLSVRTAPSNAPLPIVKDLPNMNQQQIQHELYESALNHFAPAGVIVDSNNHIVHFFKDIKRYLNFPQGQASYHLLDLIDPQLSMVVSNMLFRIRKDKNEVYLSKVKFSENGRTTFLNLSAKLVQLKRIKQEFVIVSIAEYQDSRPEPIDDADHRYDFDEQATERIRELERELQYREENLQTTVEELETSNEELQATNEELVSSNEELQSTNEELQSVNEELYTVNSQYQDKINELTTLNNDMSNLLANTQIGTLFLDSQQTIRKFTQEITRIINVLDTDIGRPFTHLTFNCDYQHLYRDVNDVLDTLQIKEVEVKGHDGEWYLLKIQPYRHSDRSIHGVLITQINISALKKATVLNLKLGQAIEQSSLNIVITDIDGNIEYVNHSFYETTGYTVDEVIGQNPRILKSGQHTRAFYRDLWETLSAGKIWKGEFHNRKKNGELYWESALISPLVDDSGQVINYLAVKEDITARKTVEQALAESEEKYRTLFETMTQGVVYQDAKGEIISANPAAQRILGLSLDQMLGRTSIDPRWRAMREDGSNFPGEEHPAMVALRTGEKVQNVIMGVYNPYDNQTSWIKVDAIPHFRPGEDKPYQVYATFDDVTKQKTAEKELNRKNRQVKDQNDELQAANEQINQTNESLGEANARLELSQKKYQMLFNTLKFGFAYHRLIVDADGQPVDYEFIKVNDAFEKLTGLKKEDVIGKTVKTVLPQTEDFWIQTYGRVALNNETYEFEHFSEALNKHFKVNAYSPETGYFVAIFEAIGD